VSDIVQTRCVYRFPHDAVQGDITVVEDERGVTVTVEPYFVSPSDRPVLAFIEVFDSDGVALRRETDRISGATGRRQSFDANARVRPRFEARKASTAPPSETEETEDLVPTPALKRLKPRPSIIASDAVTPE